MTEPERLAPREEDRVRGGWLAGVAVVTILIGAIAVVASRLVDRPARVPSNPHEAAKTIGMGEQTPFDGTPRGMALRDSQRARLEHYGWVNRDAGEAFIPIDRAIDIVAKKGGR